VRLCSVNGTLREGQTHRANTEEYLFAQPSCTTASRKMHYDGHAVTR
jgi:hypothetical protein